MLCVHVPGCGGYADNRVGAVSTTGYGEAIMKVTLARLILFHMEQGNTQTAHKYAGEEDHKFLLSALRSVSRGSQRFSPGLHEVQSGRSRWGGDSGPSRSLGRSFLQRPDVLGCSSGGCSALRSVRRGTPDREHHHPTMTKKKCWWFKK